MSSILLDTQALLWFAEGDSKLSKKSLQSVVDGKNTLLLSVASIWEIAIKSSLGKIKLKESLPELIDKQISINRVQLLQISLEHVCAVEKLPFIHRDPFDRLLAAQAKIEKLHIVSSDAVFDAYKVNRIW